MDLNKKVFTFIGAGNMAEALVSSVIGAGVCSPENLRVADVKTDRLDHFRDAFCVTTLNDNSAAVRDADVVVLAVKPQIIDGVIEGIRDDIDHAALLISIAAGIQTVRIEGLMGRASRVIRVMPNMPAMSGCGASAICAGAHATADDVSIAETMLGSAGIVVRVDEEDMNSVTALSGSGPAYVFYLMEAMQKAAVKMGLDPDTAFRLVAATVEGAAVTMRKSGLDPSELRGRVTSPGGTTHAALNVLEERNFLEAVMDAMKAARRRSEELSES